MPGYTCKIVIEDTHPPVWRRVIVPDQITFFELHKIIQILFDWDDVHLHGFHIPSDDIVIDDEGGFDLWGNHYNDFDTNIDFFFKNDIQNWSNIKGIISWKTAEGSGTGK